MKVKSLVEVNGAKRLGVISKDLELSVGVSCGLRVSTFRVRKREFLYTLMTTFGDPFNLV